MALRKEPSPTSSSSHSSSSSSSSSSSTKIIKLMEYKPKKKDEYITVKYDNRVVISFSRELFNKRFGFTLTYGVFYTQNRSLKADRILGSYLESHQSYSTPGASEVKKFLDDPQNFFDLRYINKKCAFAITMNKSALLGTITDLYCGELIYWESSLNDSLEDTVYDMSVTSNIRVRAKDYGSLSRFAIHAPSKKKVPQLPLGSIDPSHVVTNNHTFTLELHEGKPVHAFRTTRGVNKGELVTIDYGDGYWKRRGWPCLFVKKPSSSLTYIANYSNDTGTYVTDRTKYFRFG